MSEQPLAGTYPTSDADDACVDDFYVRKINWLNTVGRTDLIDEIADDCERRRAEPTRAADPADPSAPGAPEQPRPVTTGTRLAVARLSRVPRPAYRHQPGSRSIRG